MLKDFGCPRKVKIKDSSGTVINPATNEKLDELKTLLTAISGYVDELEIKADTINLNTDTLEAKIQSVRDQLDVLLSTRASEVTSQAILSALGQESGTNILTELQSIVARLDVDLSTLATEATLQQVEGHLDTVETKLQTIIDRLDVNLSTRASELTLQEVRDTIGQESASTVLSRLKDLWDKLVELFNNGVAKVKLWDGTNVAAIVSQSGDVNRVAVDVGQNIDVTVTDSDSPTKYQLKSDYDVSGIELNTSTDIVLFSFSGAGVIDLISVNCLNSANWLVAIIIDGVERIRIGMPDLGSNLGLANSDYDIAVEVANKQFRYHPAQVGFASNFTVKARALVGTPDVNYMVLYREKVTT